MLRGQRFFLEVDSCQEDKELLNYVLYTTRALILWIAPLHVRLIVISFLWKTPGQRDGQTREQLDRFCSREIPITWIVVWVRNGGLQSYTPQLARPSELCLHIQSFYCNWSFQGSIKKIFSHWILSETLWICTAPECMRGTRSPAGSPKT